MSEKFKSYKVKRFSMFRSRKALASLHPMLYTYLLPYHIHA